MRKSLMSRMGMTAGVLAGLCVMALSASACLVDDGTFDEALWSQKRTLFESHVVED